MATTNLMVSAMALAAQLAVPGAAPVDAPQAPQTPPAQTAQPAPTPAPQQEDPIKLGEIPLDAVAAKQAQPVAPLKIGPSSVDVSVSFPTADGFSLAFRQAGKAVEVALADLKTKQAVELPYGHYKAGLFAGQLELTNPDGDLARAKVDFLLGKTMAKAAQVNFNPVTYGMLLEGAPDKLESVALIRQDQNGQYWVAWHSAGELKDIVWLLAVDGKMFGIKYEDGKLGVYGKPVPKLPMAILLDGAKALSLK